MLKHWWPVDLFLSSSWGEVRVVFLSFLQCFTVHHQYKVWTYSREIRWGGSCLSWGIARIDFDCQRMLFRVIWFHSLGKKCMGTQLFFVDVVSMLVTTKFCSSDMCSVEWPKCHVTALVLLEPCTCSSSLSHTFSLDKIFLWLLSVISFSTGRDCEKIVNEWVDVVVYQYNPCVMSMWLCVIECALQVYVLHNFVSGL